MMFALLFALTVIIIGIGLLCYLVDVLIGEQRRIITHLTRLQPRRKPPADPE